MSANCSIKLRVDQLPKLFSKMEFFMFRAMEQKGMDFYKISQQPKTVESVAVLEDIKSNKMTKEKLESLVGKKYAEGLIAASKIENTNSIGTDVYRIAQMAHLFDSIKNELIPNFVTDYIDKAKTLRELNEEEDAKLYEMFASNLQNIISNWDQIAPNFLTSSDIFNVKTKFKLDEDGLVDLNDVADDEKKMVKKMVFDRPANEINPIDDVDKAVELFLRSIHVKDRDDDYGYTVNVDYATFIKDIFNDVQGSLGLAEILEKLEKNKTKVPEYQQIIDKFAYKENPTIEETQFRINFTQSFSKAFMPIMLTSIEKQNGQLAFKVLEAASGKTSLYEKIVGSNFTSRGMRVNDGEKIINLAHQVDGAWMLTKDDIPKIEEFLDKSKLTDAEFRRRRVEFLKGLGFEFSPKTEQDLILTNYLGAINAKNTVFTYIYNALIKSLKPREDDTPNNVVILDPIKIIKQPVKGLSEEERKQNKTDWSGQNNAIMGIIAEELKNNTSYNVEKSVITAEGTMMNSIQLHNNFSILNKFFSDADKYKSLEEIRDAEPSMFWLDPEKNPNIRGDYYLNSLFYLDPNSENYGERRKVKNGKYSTDADATPVMLTIRNTGGVQLKLIDDFEKEGVSSTSLNELDKILQDIHNFFASNKGFAGVLRLSDKSTDLGIGLNFGFNPVTGQPVPYGKPLGLKKDESPDANTMFTREDFRINIKKAIIDHVQMRYLGERGFFQEQDGDSGLTVSEANYKKWSYFEDILTADTKKDIVDYLQTLIDKPSEDNLDLIADKITKDLSQKINDDILTYFTKKSQSFFTKINNIRTKFGLYDKDLIGRDNLRGNIAYYIANSFITDLSQMKLFFGDAMYFKAFHKRASKDSATGLFAIMDDRLIEDLNNEGNAQGYGPNTNLSAKRLIERVYQGQMDELEKSNASDEEKQALKKEYETQRDNALAKQKVSQSFKSAVLNDILLDSEQVTKISDNIDKLLLSDKGYISDQMKELYLKEKGIRDVIIDKYRNANIADGQGKCTFDFYRIMSLATKSWLPEQEEVYKKIVEYDHYDELADNATDDRKRTEYIQKRDAVGYDPTQPVYFPPKKFQYSGPEEYSRIIDSKEYNTYAPIFDKFSLQPLIPTVIKKNGVKTADWFLNRKMEYNGVGYVKFESGSKVETPKNKDNFYSKYDGSNLDGREVANFNPKATFSSEQELFFTHFKEQVTIDAEIHDAAVFGSQIRKLILMNLDRPEFVGMANKYSNLIGDLTKIEKASLYNEMGIQKVGERLKITDMNKIVDYFFNQISKKDQDINVKKALKYDEATKKFEIPLDAAVQAQVLEGIIVSAINNRIVRYKTNGSMLVQMAQAGSEGIKYDKNASSLALQQYGNENLKYYDLIDDGQGGFTVSKMEVKIALTGQWLNLLNLDGVDKRKIETIDRLNESLRDVNWRKMHEKKLSMIAYRIPTQGRNFLDVMIVKEFLPASVGDAIVMPHDIVTKSGSDFDIDKMFVFYPNLTEKGNYMGGSYTQEDLSNPSNYKELKGIVQNKLYETMAEIILHPSNYMELVTPSANYHILPLLDKVFERLGMKEEGKDRQKTDYKNSKILERELNYQKFLSLLKGKSDLGIAAIANTFNVLFQLANASANTGFLSKENIKTFFTSLHVEKTNNYVRNIDFSSIFDEDNVLKSEFFSEFISAFVDTANDDYVFAANVVTELSPVMFYMKYAGIGSGKILNFVNQPAIREYTRMLSIYQNKFIKLNDMGIDDTGNEYAIKSARKLAMTSVLNDLGFINFRDKSGSYKKEDIEDYIKERKQAFGITDLDVHFTEQALLDSIKKDKTEISTLTEEEKLVQVAMLFELENLKEQSNSMAEAQRILNFDTNPFANSFDVYSRSEAYKTAIANTQYNYGNNILSASSFDYIKRKSMISHLDTSTDIAHILSDIFPVRNNITFNKFLFDRMESLKKERLFLNQDSMLKFARTAKNDYINYVLQNNIEKSEEGMKFFRETFDTTKGFNEYLKELVQTRKLVDMWNTVKDMKYKETDEKGVEREYSTFELLSKQEYTFIKNIVNTIGNNEKRINTFAIIEGSSNRVEKDSIISQFDRLCFSLNDAESKPIRDFFRNLALYSIFQSGMNTSDVSYTNVTPVGIVNKLYGYAMEEKIKETANQTDQEKYDSFKDFSDLFTQNNPVLFNLLSTATPTREISSRGKWYAKDVKFEWQSTAEKNGLPKVEPIWVKGLANIPQDKVSGVESWGSTDTASNEVIKALGPAPHSIDMIIAGYRTRTTRSAKAMSKLNIKVGDLVKHFGMSADGTLKEVMARVTAIHDYLTPGWKGTWEKEGWTAEDVKNIDRMVGGSAIEFELVSMPNGPEEAEKMLLGVGARKVAKSWLQVDGQHWFVEPDKYKVLEKPGNRQELYISDNVGDELYIGSRKIGTKNFISNKEKAKPAVTVKPAVKEVFNSNPELASIGTAEQYSAYLDSIFPNSKVKDIVYHGTYKRLESFNKATIDERYGTGAIFFANLDYAKTFGDTYSKENVTVNGITGSGESILIPTLINITNPLQVSDVKFLRKRLKPGFVSPGGTKDARDILNNNKENDGLIGKDYSDIENQTYVVRDADQTHILGSKQDTEAFKKFVARSTPLTVNPEAAKYTNYSGGAAGGDTVWAVEGKKVGIGKQVDYRPETLDKLKPEQYQECEDAYRAASKALGRVFLDPKSTNSKIAYAGKLMTRDYLQAKAADAIFAISDILNPGEFGKPTSNGKKYENKAGKQVVDGGTGYAVEMAIQLGNRPVYVFHQGTDPNHKTAVGWYKWDGKQFVATEIPTLTKKYAGVGTRHLNEAGAQAIRDVYQKTFGGGVPTEGTKVVPVVLSPVKPNPGAVQSRVQIQAGFFDYGKLSAEDEKTILDEAIKQTNKQGYPVKKAVVYAHWGNMWAVNNKGNEGFPVFGKHLRKDANGKIDLPVAPIESAELAGNPNAKSWYEYYTTDQNGEKLAPIPQVVKDILQKKLGIDMSVYDSAIINSYGEATELSRHIDNTEDKGNAYKIPIVSISLVGDSVFQYSEPSNNPTHFLPDKNKINLAPGQVVIFGGPSRAMAHRVLNGKSGNAIEIKNSIGSLKTERINITLRRALPLSEEEYNKWVENNKTLKEASEKEKQIISSEMKIEDRIDNWIEKELPWSISTPASEIAEMYKKEKLSSETIEEFLNRLSCAGKLI